jgi:hypothetical protein
MNKKGMERRVFLGTLAAGTAALGSGRRAVGAGLRQGLPPSEVAAGRWERTRR